MKPMKCFLTLSSHRETNPVSAMIGEPVALPRLTFNVYSASSTPVKPSRNYMMREEAQTCRDKERFPRPYHIRKSSPICHFVDIETFPSTDNFTASSTSGAEPSSDLLSSVLTAHVIQDFNLVPYPEGIQRPDANLNTNVREGKFRYVF